MKNNIYRFSILFILFLQVFVSKAQTNAMPLPLIRDRWDTLVANVQYSNNTTYLYQNDLLKMGNDLVLLSDSNGASNDGSYFQIFNTTTNSLSTINFQRTLMDGGVNSGAVYTATNGVNYVFWGARNKSFSSTEWSFYKYNSSTSAITSETFAIASLNNHYGVEDVCFYSPSTANDSMTIFVKKYLVSDDSTYIYRKHFNQSGVVNTQVKLPIKFVGISKVFTFNNTLYVAGYDFSYDCHLFKSTDGINFTEETNYYSNYPYEWIEDAKIMNGKLYLGLRSNASGFKIVETPDGINYTTLVYNTNSYAITSLEVFNNTLWYSYWMFTGSKAGNSSANTQWYADYAPYVGYLDPANNEVLSIDTLGREYNDGQSFKLSSVNSKLLLSGSYYVSNSPPGNFIYQFIPPVASFSVPGNNLCANSPYTFTNQSMNADSVRWYVDNNFSMSTSNAFNHSFSLGTHTIGLIAISGTQKDSIQFVINAYTVTAQYNPTLTGCLNNNISITSSAPGAVPPINYSWMVSSALTQTSLTNANVVVSVSVTGNYTYALNITDANGCFAYGATGSLVVSPNKDITGSVDVSSTPLTTGTVTLFKYEPILTKFDAITSQPLNASGTFTFTLPDAYTYLIKCEPANGTLQTTYAPSEISWKTATVVTHGCNNNTNQNISVIPLANIGTGPGVLSGKIVEGIGYGNKGNVTPGSPVGGLTIKGGKNPGGNINAQTVTDPAGGYTITNLPLSGPGESYFILVDVSGLDTNQTYHRVISTIANSFTDLDFVVDSAMINPTNDVFVRELKIGDDLVKIFPNPTNAILNIHLSLDHMQSVSLKLFDISGKEIKNILPSSQYFNNELKIQTRVDNVDPGVYFIKINIGEAERNVRVVIAH